MFRRFASGALFAALIVTLAAPPAQAAQLTSPGVSLLDTLASWFAHWWPWAAARTPPVTLKCGGMIDPDGRCLAPTPPSIVKPHCGGATDPDGRCLAPTPPFCGGGINPDGCH
jgi:hypothetical protein